MTCLNSSIEIDWYTFFKCGSLVIYALHKKKTEWAAKGVKNLIEYFTKFILLDRFYLHLITNIIINDLIKINIMLLISFCQ